MPITLDTAPAPPAAVGVAAADTAADPRLVQPERPTVATHAHTVAAGYTELETGGERDRYGADTRGFLVPTELKVGLGVRQQLNLYVPLQSATGVSFGLGDVAAGLKWRLLDDAPVLGDFALLPVVKFSTGGARGTGTTDGTLLVISSHQLGRVALDLNAGATRRSGDGTRTPRTATSWTVSTGTAVTQRLGWALECFGFPGTSGPAGTAPIVGLLAGPTFQVVPSLAVDLGAIVPVAGPQPHAVYAGLVHNLGRVWRR